MRSFFRFFAERHILATLITVMTVLLGLNTLLHVKRDSYPDVSYGVMNITTRYPGASPRDVELNVTNKIENELKGVSGIDRFTSFSMENVSVIDVVIDINESDQDEIKNEIREAVGRVTDFPKEVTESPEVKEVKVSLVPIIEVGLTGDLPYRELRELARLFEKKLKDIPGVGKVDRFGYRAREIKVEVSQRSIREYQIPLGEIIAAIQKRNIRGTAGSFESFTSEKDLVTLAQFEEPRAVGDVIVRSTFDGPLVTVKDIAVINDSFEDERVLSRVAGRSVISFNVYKSEAADVIRTCDAIKELAETHSRYLPEGVEILYTADFSRYVRNRFDVVLSNGLIGLLLVVILLPMFLGFRTAFWVAMGIPVTFLGTIFLLPAFGVYLDSITLTAMILVIGIIVDDAIIIAENVTRYREKGMQPIDAAVAGVHEVFNPVLTTILTTFLVFAPCFS
jgi:multidrug efflux pump subunit AcrB